MKKSLSNADNQHEIRLRLDQLSPQDHRLWGRMSVGQMVCHLTDAYQIALAERVASPATSVMPRALMKQVALTSPMQWPRGFATRPEVEQGKGGTTPGEFAADHAKLLATFGRFCDGLPTPCVPHPNFGAMTVQDWMRWGYLHADHHLRQFSR